MELATIVKSQKEYFNRGSTLSNAARKRALEKLLDSIDNESILLHIYTHIKTIFELLNKI